MSDCDFPQCRCVWYCWKRKPRERITALEAENKALREALQWCVDNDETNEGGDWEEINEFWLAGLSRARALLAKEAK